MIEQAYKVGESLDIAVWCGDQAGPFQTIPYPGNSWETEGQPKQQPHEYIRNGTAKMMTLFHPADGQVRVKGVLSCPNSVLHPWLKEELAVILNALPKPQVTFSPEDNRLLWAKWSEGLSHPLTLPDELPPLRLLFVIDNLKGHKSPEAITSALVADVV